MTSKLNELPEKEYREQILKNSTVLSQTFSTDSETLPTINQIEMEILLDQYHTSHLNLDTNSYLNLSFITTSIRKAYTKFCFPLLSHEFLTDLSKLLRTVVFKNKKIVELASEMGWLSHWLMKYGITMTKVIDDYSWPFDWKQAHPFVEKQNAIDCVLEFRNNPEVLFILSWPYMDDLATKIWRNMRVGQYLLYIGEDYDGCTASDEFFELTEDQQQAFEINRYFVSFNFVHDRCHIYRKSKRTRKKAKEKGVEK